MRHEYPNNTNEQVAEYISKGAQLVDDLGIPDDLRVQAFAMAVNLYSAKQITMDQVAPGILGAQLGRG